MTRYIVSVIVCMMVMTGCATRSPVIPQYEPVDGGLANAAASMQGNHMLWGEWTFYFNAGHDRVEVVPNRQGRFHLNSTKFLEEYCADCLEVTNINNNGDSTIDLTVRIKHPFPDNPEYTGFDVKGIIMFNGSHKLYWLSDNIYPYYNQFVISWRDAGDPEVLNADGYSVLWTSAWESGSDLPIFSYWPGKYSNGTPTANVNAYLDFYTDEERHMFRVDGKKERTYHLFLPPGPVAAGYAIDACWEPPTVTPVTDPLNDFPISANQIEPYFCRLVVNNDEVITYSPCCGYPYQNCDDFRIEFRKWHGETPRHMGISFPPPYALPLYGWSGMEDCDAEPPPGEHWLMPAKANFTKYDDGTHRGIAVIYHVNFDLPDWPRDSIYYDIFDFTIDLE